MTIRSADRRRPPVFWPHGSAGDASDAVVVTPESAGWLYAWLRFYTRGKAVTTRWPGRRRPGIDRGFPTST